MDLRINFYYNKYINFIHEPNIKYPLRYLLVHDKLSFRPHLIGKTKNSPVIVVEKKNLRRGLPYKAENVPQWVLMQRVAFLKKALLHDVFPKEAFFSDLIKDLFNHWMKIDILNMVTAYSLGIKRFLLPTFPEEKSKGCKS